MNLAFRCDSLFSDPFLRGIMKIDHIEEQFAPVSFTCENVTELRIMLAILGNYSDIAKLIAGSGYIDSMCASEVSDVIDGMISTGKWNELSAYTRKFD